MFTDFCDASAFWVDFPASCKRSPDANGDEHEVWFENEWVIKLTFSDFYGLKVVYRLDGDQRSLPSEYFQRWNLHNEIFGDDVELLGAVKTADGPRIVMKQKAISGTPASIEQIQEFFTGNGWKRFDTGGQIAWFDPERSLVVSDTHPGNLIMTSDGIAVPIDFRIQVVEGALLDAVRSMCKDG